MNQSASIDPRQRKIGQIMKQTFRERHVDGPPEHVATEQTPQSGHSLFDFDELETLEQHEFIGLFMNEMIVARTLAKDFDWPRGELCRRP